MALWTTRVLPRTSTATRSSAAADPVARAKGATPVVRTTLNGPSTRTLSKLVMPKLRVAAPAGGVTAASARAAERKVRMTAPSSIMVKTGLRGGAHEQRTLPDPCLLTEHLAPPV